MFPFDLIHIIIVLAIVGLVLWGIAQFPLDATIVKLIRVVVIFFVCIWLLLGVASAFGVAGAGHLGPCRT